MITQSSELLQTFMNEEAEKIASIEMAHMPTLGTAFEEITKKGIQQKFVIPPNLNLRVVSGFMRIGNVTLPNQIDCMLVHGEGEAYGLTDQFFYDVENILVIFEVKKSLNSTALKDAYAHLGSLRKAFSDHFADKMEAGGLRPDIRDASLYYSKLTGEHGPLNYDDIQNLDIDKKMLFYTMVIEQLSPVNIIHGYEGYATESGLRKALVNVISPPQKVKKNKGKTKTKEIDLKPYSGVSGLPNLITSNGFSLVKANGYPYFMSGSKKNTWPIIASSRENPLRLMLEVIWTKISQRFDIDMPWGDDLTEEVITPLLLAKVVNRDNNIGWVYNSYDVTESKLKKIKNKNWEPQFISKNSMTIIRRISYTNKGFIINEEEKEGTKNYCGESLDNLSKELLRTTFFALSGNEILTTHRTTYILDDDQGGWVTTEFGRLMQWKSQKGMRGAVIHTIIMD